MPVQQKFFPNKTLSGRLPLLASAHAAGLSLCECPCASLYVRCVYTQKWSMCAFHTTAACDKVS